MAKEINKLIRFVLPAVILSAGLVLMVLGIIRGEQQEILTKAIFVCLECIGIG